jgi:hypothetical protein
VACNLQRYDSGELSTGEELVVGMHEGVGLDDNKF